MSFYPDGQPRIPNQTPVPRPYRVETDPEAERRRFTRDLLRRGFSTVLILVVAGWMFARTGGGRSFAVFFVVFAVIALVPVLTTFMQHRQRQRAMAAAHPPAPTPPAPRPVAVHDLPPAAPVDVGFWPTPTTQQDAPVDGFTMPVQDVFFITGRGVVVTGQVEHGQLQVGQRVTVLRGDRTVTVTEVTAIETYRTLMTTASAGDNVGLLLAGVRNGDLARGDVVVI